MDDEHREQSRDESAPVEGSHSGQYAAHAGGSAPTAAVHPGAAQQPYRAPYQPPYPTASWPTGAAPWGTPGDPYAPGFHGSGGQPPLPPLGQGVAVPEHPRPGRGRTGIVVAALLAGLVGGGAAGAGTVALLDRHSGGTTLTQVPASSTSTAAATTPGSVAAAAGKAMPSTVDIQVDLAKGSGEGSGVVLTADGDVLTNNHVVSGAQGDIGVTMADGTEHTATVLGTSPSYDLAVIKLQGVSGLTPATLGQSSVLQVGQQVVAIGSPQGLTGTVTDGIVSAINRTVAVQGEDGSSVVYNGLQTDAAINPGNSGGPLVNLDGQVVGVNSAIATADSASSTGQGGSIGLGFAIPIDQAKRVAQEIIQTGSATKPVLGVAGSVDGSRTASAGSGAQISTVQSGSPAAAAGLKAGDVVTKVGAARVEDFADLIARIGASAPGSTVTLTVGTGSAAHTATVTLGGQTDKAASTDTGGESTNPFGKQGQNQSPFGNTNPFGGN